MKVYNKIISIKQLKTNKKIISNNQWKKIYNKIINVKQMKTYNKIINNNNNKHY